MIVDDDPINVDIISEILTDTFEVKRAFSGEDALASIHQFMPDLILLDIMMPGLNGYEICRIIKADKKLQQIKVVFVSAKAMPEELEFGFKAGADAYITKPFNHEVLFDEVNQLINLVNGS